MEKDLRQSCRALMKRHLSSGTKEGMFHALVIAKIFSEHSAYFLGVIEGFPSCEICDQGSYLINGSAIRFWRQWDDDELFQDHNRLLARLR